MKNILVTMDDGKVGISNSRIMVEVESTDDEELTITLLSNVQVVITGGNVRMECRDPKTNYWYPIVLYPCEMPEVT